MVNHAAIINKYYYPNIHAATVDYNLLKKKKMIFFFPLHYERELSIDSMLQNSSCEFVVVDSDYLDII